MNREELVKEMADRMLCAVDIQTIFDTFYQVQCDHYITLDDEQLKEEAENLEINVEDYEDV